MEIDTNAYTHQQEEYYGLTYQSEDRTEKIFIRNTSNNIYNFINNIHIMDTFCSLNKISVSNQFYTLDQIKEIINENLDIEVSIIDELDFKTIEGSDDLDEIIMNLTCFNLSNKSKGHYQHVPW